MGPVLSDDWSGRIVSTHASDVMRDLVRQFGGGRPPLYPCGAETEIRAVEGLCANGIDAAAQRAGQADVDAADREDALGSLFRTLDSLEGRLSTSDYLLGDQLTAADVELWVSLLQLDTVHRHHLDTAAVHRIAGHTALWAHARHLAAHPAFAAHPGPRRHRPPPPRPLPGAGGRGSGPSRSWTGRPTPPATPRL